METPRDLFDRLRAAEAPNGILSTALSPTEAQAQFEKVGFSAEEAERKARELVETPQDLNMLMLKDAIHLAPEPFQRALDNPDELFIGALHLQAFNAQALRASNGGWLILINHALMTFLYKVARVLASQWEVPDAQGVDPGTAYTELRDLFGGYALNNAVLGGGDVPLTRQQYGAANALTATAEQFVLYHELGHHIAGHLKSGSVARLNLNGVEVPASVTSWEKEFEADRLGLEGIVVLTDGHITTDTAFSYAGIEFLFRVMEFDNGLRRRLGEKGVIPPFVPRASHPPSQDRVERIRSLARSHCADDTAFEALTGTARWVHETIESIYLGRPADAT